MMYLVTNRLPTSLTIEDIGVRLDAAGGSTSSKLLPEHTYNASRTVKEYERKRWVTTEIRPSPTVRPPVPVWPFSAPPVASQPPAPPAPSPESLMLQSLLSKLDGIIGQLQSPVTTAVAAAAVQTTPAARAPVHHAEPSHEPMFIPSNIIPKTADVNINVTQSESDKQDFDSGLEALKKARKK